jgi:hypothetical protein
MTGVGILEPPIEVCWPGVGMAPADDDPAALETGIWPEGCFWEDRPPVRRCLPGVGISSGDMASSLFGLGSFRFGLRFSGIPNSIWSSRNRRDDVAAGPRSIMAGTRDRNATGT